MGKEELIKKIMNCCFADDSGKYKNENKYRFWENFAALRVDVWSKKSDKEGQCPKIYNYAKSYSALPDPDVNSYNLYEASIKVWNKQCEKFKNENIKDIKRIDRNGRCRCEIITEDQEIVLGSDSIMSIYWHRTYGNMPDVMNDIHNNVHLNNKIEKLEKKLEEMGISKYEREKKRCYSAMRQDEHYSSYKEFIWYYLQYANTIGGFMLFPRHDCSINQLRGMSDKIQDRFDLTLECIKRMYESGFFVVGNPLFDISAEDKGFFKMFGDGKEGFKNYIDFFLLNSWVKEDEEHHYYHVKNLLHTGENEDKERNIQLLDNWDFNQKPLPQDENEWWTFYRNIMDRLEARNKQIEELLREKCSEGELQELYNSLDLD